MIRISNQSHQSGALRVTPHLNPVTHTPQTQAAPQDIHRQGKSQTQVIQTVHHSLDNRGYSGSGVQTWNGQL